MPWQPLRQSLPDLDGKPGTGVGPEVVGAARRDVEDLGDFSEGESGEVAELDEFGRLRIHFGQSFEGIADGENLFGWLPEWNVFIGKWLQGDVSAMFLTLTAASGVDEDSTHGFGGRGEEVRATVPLLLG